MVILYCKWLRKRANKKEQKIQELTISITISTDNAIWFGALVTVCSLSIREKSVFSMKSDPRYRKIIKFSCTRDWVQKYLTLALNPQSLEDDTTTNQINILSTSCNHSLLAQKAGVGCY
uniref:Uncharacterized protein n=1 Tax=Rhizophora mucronata TaxID=61149 RepID=A0A2P2LBL0_RHIMU